MVALDMKRFCFTLIFLLFCICTNAQVKNVYVGFSPLGRMTIANDKYKALYSPLTKICGTYEDRSYGFSLNTDFSLGKGVIKSATWKQDSRDKESLENDFVANSKGVTTVSLGLAAGGTFNQGNRFQFPIYLGAGLEYLLGDGLHNFTPYVYFATRAMGYITNNMGLYVGANFYTSMKDYGSYLDVGVMFTIN